MGTCWGRGVMVAVEGQRGTAAPWAALGCGPAPRPQWSLLGLPLPVTSVKETCRFYETVPTEISAVQAEKRGEQILTDYLHTLVDPYGTVSSTLCTSRQEGDCLLVTLSAECVERIGRTVPIYTEPDDTEEPGA